MYLFDNHYTYEFYGVNNNSTNLEKELEAK